MPEYTVEVTIDIKAESEEEARQKLDDKLVECEGVGKIEYWFIDELIKK